MARFDLPDGEWVIISPLLPNKPRGVPRKDDRLVLNGIFYVLRTGSPWRDLPERYGPYTTCYNRFNRWAKAGVWLKVFEATGATTATAFSISSVRSELGLTFHNLTMASFAARRYAEAIEHARRGIAEAPELSPLQAFLAASYVGLGQYDQARSALAATRRAAPKYLELILAGNLTAHNPDYR